MFVCVCHAVTDRDIHQAVDEGIQHIDQLEDHCGIGTGCGSCRSMAEALIQSRLAEGQAYAA